MVELLSPVGDFECLKAAVQSGADSVYFGGDLFNARASAKNFDREELKKAVEYAKLRNVKIDFTLNILIKDNEFEEAADLANYIYSLGVDAVIVQDLGLAKYMIEKFPDMAIHASTQMTAHNLLGVKKLEELGFKRVVLSRELSLREIQNICQNTNVEIETFIHGALCVSYSGQCLFSSSIGARSGNRGRCAQPCRLPYELHNENGKKDEMLDKGYLLSPRDLCGLNYLPELIKAGVKCFKIEGRMKTPEYVATVTKIYRKYIDLAQSNEEYKVDEKDVEELMQVFNRGGFSDGNFDNEPNTEYVYKEKPNNMGIYLGNVSNFNKKNGLITLTLKHGIEIGDKISTEKEEHKYTISELMKDGQNIRSAEAGEVVTIGRMKGKIDLGDKIYKLTSLKNSKEIIENINKENKKIPLSAIVKVKKGETLFMEVTSGDKEYGNYFSMSSKSESELIPIDAISNPITEERIKEQISKTTSTQFEFKYIKVELDENTYLPKISALNEMRRQCLEDLENQAISRFKREKVKLDEFKFDGKAKKKDTKVTLLLNELNLGFDYSKLEDVENIYVPVKYFRLKEYEDILKTLSKKSKLFIYMPTILRDNFRNVLLNDIETIIKEFEIKGLVITNVSCAKFFEKYIGNIELVANYNMNVFNNKTIEELKAMGVDRVTLSPELDKKNLQQLNNNSCVETEMMVYGRLPIMNTGYCLLGSSNRCYPTCNMGCRKEGKYYLKDRINMKFRIVPDNIQTITTIYNSRITSINYGEINPDYVRISILDEDIKEINNVIKNVREDKALQGQEYTKGNLNREV